MLERIQSYFNGVGSIFTKKGEKSELQVSSRAERGSPARYAAQDSIKDIKIVIDHFDKYPLKTKKLADYIRRLPPTPQPLRRLRVFKKAFNLILTKEHLTTEGLRKVVSIRASSNNGLSSPRERAVQHVPFGTAQDDELKAAFPNTIPAPRPEVEESLINHP